MMTAGLPLIMVFLELLWLAAIRLTGYGTDWTRIPFVAAYTVMVPILVYFLPSAFAYRIKQFKESFIISILCGVALAAGIAFTSHKTVQYDEGKLLSAMKVIATEGIGSFLFHYPQLQWLGSNHPPLVPLIYGLFWRLIARNPMVPRLVSLSFGIATMLLIHRLSRELYGRSIALLSALFFLTFPYFFQIGAVAYLDMPTTFFFTLSIFWIHRLIQKPSYPCALIGGVWVGLGLLSRYTVVLIYPLILAWVILRRPHRKAFVCLGIVFLVSAILLSSWLVWLYRIGGLLHQQHSILFHSGIMLREITKGKPILLSWWVFKKLSSAVGIYNVPLVLLAGYRLWKRRSLSDRLILAWLGAVFFPLLLTCPQPRYFMPAFPALAIAMACGLEYVSRVKEKIILVSFLYCMGNLYLLAGLHRAAS